MNDDDIDLRSVNWEHGMLLTPNHLLRQERYVDSLLLWALRYSTNAYGLVGAGARIAPAERGAAKHDPIIEVYDDGEAVKVSISQCRGISPSGEIIDIDPAHAIHQSFSKSQLEGHDEAGIYIVCEPHDKLIESGADDSANPQMKPSRHRRYQVKLDITGAEASHSLTLGQLRRSQTNLRYEKVANFIPVCTTLVSYSGIKQAWSNLSDRLVKLADRYTELHKAIVEYISMANQRGINTREDEETLQFVGRMVVTLESCSYEVLDPLQSPQEFFQQLYRAIRSAAVYLDLSPPTRDYFRQLAEVGETEFGLLLEQERQTLLTNRELTMHDNLSVDVRRIEQALYRLSRLEEALEGKYWDYRMSTALEALNFFFDRKSDPPALYQSIAKPARPQLFGEELTFVFAPLRLEGRQSYRLVLIREPGVPLEVGDNFGAEIGLNVGSGQAVKMIYGNVRSEVSEQRNFAIDFDTPPDVHTIYDLRVILNAARPVRSCLMYVRRRVVQTTAERINPSGPLTPPERLAPPAREEVRRSRLSAIENAYPPRRESSEPGQRRSRLEETPFRDEDSDREPKPRRKRLE